MCSIKQRYPHTDTYSRILPPLAEFWKHSDLNIHPSNSTHPGENLQCSKVYFVLFLSASFANMQ